MAREASFADRLKWWREHRGVSQLALAGRADVSQRHVSFLELGRAAPSRDMVMRLAASSRAFCSRSGTSSAAGFAPVWHETDLSDPDLAGVSAALDFMLAQQEPYPAVVVDRRWNLLRANSGAVRLVEFLVGPLEPDAAVNLADALVAPDILKPWLENWLDVVRYFVRSVEADAAEDGTAETAALFDRLVTYDGVREALNTSVAAEPAGPVLPMHFMKDGVSLRLFTALATLGTPYDITLQELRIESFFPADEETGRVFRDWAE